MDDELPPSRWHRAPGALLRGMSQLARRAVARQPLDAPALKQALIPFVHHLPAPLRASLQQAWRRHAPRALPAMAPDYAQRYAQEMEIFEHQEEIHDLPLIYHYWSNRWLLAIEQEFGVAHPEDFLARHLFETGGSRFVSLGCGNCDAEIRIAEDLLRRGLRDFTIECVDINATMLERGRDAAHAAGLGRYVRPVMGDFNAWRADGRYDAVLANQSLHHVTQLEDLFDEVARALGKRGKFVVSDMIGRNGHQRWPEALAIVREFWQELPASYRYHLQLKRQEDEFIDWDCSVEGFEGIRSQDILPLMVERFGFHVFIGFGNVVDPFIDRGFGRHFNAEAEWDRDFIDRVHARDEAEMQAGRITPTHMMAVASNVRGAVCHYRKNLSPAWCVRRPD